MDWTKIIHESLCKVLEDSGDFRYKNGRLPDFIFEADIDYHRTYGMHHIVGKGAIYTLTIYIANDQGRVKYNISDDNLYKVAALICEKADKKAASVFAYRNLIKIIWLDEDAIAIKNSESIKALPGNAANTYARRDLLINREMMLQIPLDSGYLAYKKQPDSNDTFIEEHIRGRIISMEERDEGKTIHITFQPTDDTIYVEDTYEGSKHRTFSVLYHWFEEPRLAPVEDVC